MRRAKWKSRHVAVQLLRLNWVIALFALAHVATSDTAIDDPARLVVRPDASIVVEESPVNFFCRADGNPLPNVQWRVNGKSVSIGGDSRFSSKAMKNGLSTLRMDSVQASDNNSLIVCSADNGVANPIHAEATLTVYRKKETPLGFPRIEAHPSIKAVESGRTAHVTCRVDGDPRPKVLWLRDSIPIDIRADDRYSISTLSNPGALMIQRASEEDQGKYECVARNVHGVQHSRGAQLYVKVRRVPPYFSYKLEKLYKVGMGGSINLTCVAVGFPMPRVLWKKKNEAVLDEIAMSPIGKNVLTLQNVEQTENYTCIAVSKLGNIEATTTVEVKALPAAPVNLRITAVAAQSVSLAWDTVNIAGEEPIVKHVIKFRQKTSPASPVTTKSPQLVLLPTISGMYAESGSGFREHSVDAKATSATISGLEPFQLYEFTVQSVNIVGAGPLSLPREAQTGESPPSSPPLRVQTKAYQNTALLVQWSAPEHPNGFITGYKIYYTDESREDPLSKWKMQETKSDEHMTTVRGLQTDKKYFVVVRAVNSQGESPSSAISTVKTVYGLPAQPYSIVATPLDAQRIQLSWQAPIHTNAISGYVIRYNASEGEERELKLTHTREKHVVEDLQPLTTYAFQVAAQSSRGQGEFSEPMIAKTLNGTVLPPPLLHDPFSPFSTSINVTWDPLPDNFTFSEYVIRYRPLSPAKVDTSISSESGETEWEQPQAFKRKKLHRKIPYMEKRVSSLNETTVVLLNLKPFTVYEITVAAGSGEGEPSEVKKVTTREGAQMDGSVPSAPRNLRVELINANEVRVSWDPPQYANGQLRGYYVYKERLENGVPVGDHIHKASAIMDPKKLYAIVSSLEPNREYAFRVNAFNRNGDGEFSESRSILTGGLPPKKPEVIRVTVLRHDDSPPLKAVVEWATPNYAPLEAPIDRYNILYRQQGKQDFKKLTTKNGDVNSTVIDDLWMGQIYEVIVNAENGEGLSENATEQLATPIGSPEAEPLHVKYEIVDEKMRLSWDPPPEERRNGNITSYKAILTPMDSDAQRMEKTNYPSLSVPPKKASSICNELTSERYVDFQVSPHKSYTFKVSASTMKGSGPFSPVLTIVPDPGGFGEALSESGNLNAIMDIAISSADVFNAIVNRPPGPMDIVYRAADDSIDRRIKEGFDKIGPKTIGLNVISTEIVPENDEAPTLTTFVSPVPEHTEALTSPLTAVVSLSPVPEHPEALTSPLTTVVTAPTNITDKFTRTTREFLWIIKEKRPKALVAQPSNVRVEATSNSSAVIQWDYESETQIDGFVVRYMHEPGGKSDTDKWHSRTVMSPSARYLVINQLNAHKPYAFCVLAISQNRQGSCSDPWTTIERLQPIYMVTNLAISWKTDSSAMVKWEYNGPQPVKFFLNSTGKKEYMDHNLELKRIMSPGYRVEVDGSKREHLFTSFRPHTRYTIHVGVETLPPGAREYWPAEITVQTNPRAPPMVATPVIAPTFTDLSTGQAVVTFFPASEEYGEISHYFVIVVPQNVTWAHPNDDPLELERVTKLKAARLSQGVSVQPARKRKRERDRDSAAEVQEEIEELEGLPVKRSRKDISPNPLLKNLPNKSSPSNRRRRSPPLPQTNVPATNGAYITARINAERMREMYRAKEQFVIGDGQKYSNYVNFKLDEAEHFRVVMRAYANSGRDFGGAPMGDRGTKLYADSLPSEPFVPKGGSGRPPSPAGSMWLLGPIIVLVCIGLLIGMLVCWWLRCNKKSVGRGNSLRHSSITKVALGTHHLNGNGNGTAIVSETSKLLGNDYGRAPIMHPYEQMNGNAESSLDHLYPLPSSAQRSHVVAPNGNVPGYVPCLPSSGGVIGGLSLSHPPVPITELAAHIEKLRANNNAGFIQEFESMEVGQQFTWDASSSEYNKHKNRYANVVAYDHSRVILTSVDGIPGSDYVNANYIDGYDRPRAYIATQGPLPETFDDFWRMVWEESSMTIVMLTNLEENSRTKCDQYWPSRGTAHYGDVEVSLVEVTVLAHYTMRTFRLSIEGEGEAREVRHFQYTAWPDHGVPDHPTPFLMFLKRVKTLNPPDAGPIISHCSAGIGRTGAFIVIDCMLERLRYEHTVDIFGCVQALRAQRTYMVQIDDQYMFIHDAILDAVLSGSTEVPARRLHQHVTALIQIPPMESLSALEQEFRQLNNFRLLNARCADANLPVNRHKNRRMDVIPYDSNRVLLHHVPGVEGSDYINASWIDGYRERCAYIATQAPGESTIVDFWRMVWEHDAGIIVVLKMSYDGTMGREHSQSRLEYWPSEQGVQVGQLVVEPIAEYNMPQYILREFKISDLQTKMSRTLRHFEYIDWPELSAAPKNAEMFIDFIQQVHRTKTQFGVDGPIVVHCATGASRTGVFIALAQIIDRIRLENVVDVFTTVKLLRTERQGMVTEKDQYQFLYLAAREYLNSYDAPL